MSARKTTRRTGRSTFTRTIGVAVTSMALVLGFHTQAMAYDATMRTGDAFGKITGYSGKGYWTEYGDVVKICDIKADGYAVRMHVFLDEPYGAKVYSFYVGGKGSCKERRRSNGYNLPDNRWIGFLFCRYKAGHDSECKAYRFYNG
ncbi:hypothetical protein I3F58_16205 [Streptomyces sp. MUM 203J]|uniref:hypothetical protein n=1 Tax=Streptomyces sp. MUM 203J TaxID=2791990 RepID=UPI001F04386A|nr:hypothetical protein [Streptomyces sp. MUM 203J]MCH0541082.1 hypothetical protein [Streptomyces sp. MUM 203J]